MSVEHGALKEERDIVRSFGDSSIFNTNWAKEFEWLRYVHDDSNYWDYDHGVSVNVVVRVDKSIDSHIQQNPRQNPND